MFACIYQFSHSVEFLVNAHILHVSVTCTFEESHICGYTQDTSDNFNWDRGSGATITPNTGPAADHTLGSGSGLCMHWLSCHL